MKTAPLPPLRLCRNRMCDREAAYGPAQRAVMDRPSRERAFATISAWPGYAPTPLVELPGLARMLGLGRLRIKHEGRRFGLGSFKALGGAYGAMRVLERRLGVPPGALAAGRSRKEARRLTLCCATDGNHGRAVAWGAALAGARCVIYLHRHVSMGRERAIAALGAEIVRVEGNYDDSLRRVAEDARRHGWIVVSDTSATDRDPVPAWVMQGYGVLMAEAMEQLGAARPSHFFVQAGVGGLAGATVAPLWEDWGGERPFSTVVEPHESDCLYQSASRGRLTPGLGSLDTFMACLSAGEGSVPAWTILAGGADAFVTIDDDFARRAMRLLAAGRDGDRRLAVGESGAAGLAAAVAILESGHDGGAPADLGRDSDVLLIASEGATDPRIYAETVGSTPAEVEDDA